MKKYKYGFVKNDKLPQIKEVLVNHKKWLETEIVN